MWFMQNALGNPENAGAGSTDYMHLFGLVALGYMWCLIAEAAKAEGARPEVTAAASAWRRSLPPAASSRSACCRPRRRISRASRPAPPRRWRCRPKRSNGPRSPERLPPAFRPNSNWAIWGCRFSGRSTHPAITAGAARPPVSRRARPARRKRMPDAFIYDHVRTPRGRGKVDGSLHEVTALNLASQALGAIKSRNDLDPAMVDDVVMGVCRSGRRSRRRHRAHRGAGRRLSATPSPACRSTVSVPPASMPSISPLRRSCQGNRTWPSAAASSR